MVKTKIDEQVMLDIADLLDHIKDSLERLDVDELSDWSNKVIESIAIYRDKRAVYVAIIAYSLSKLVEKNKEKLVKKEDWNNFISNTLKNLVKAIQSLEKKNLNKFDGLITVILRDISRFDKSFSHYAQKVLEFSKIQKGAKIYEHGISIASIAEMLGVSKWELMRKVGELKDKPKIVAGFVITKSPRKRLEELKRIAKK